MEGQTVKVRPVSALFLALYLLSMPAYCLIRLTGDDPLITVSTAVTAVSLFAFSLVHCAETRGAARSQIMLFSTFTIALMMEYLGSAHDILFGVYDYSGLLGPKALGAVPIIIPVAWFMMLYPSWEVAGLLSKTSNVKSKGAEFTFHVLRIVLAALAMTAWDLSLDPRMVADGAWTWRNVPALNFFGIPLSNFAGWFVTSALIYAVWTIVERGVGSGAGERLPPRPALHATLPVWAYVITWVGESMANALFWGGLAVAAWVFVAMGLFGAPALWLLIKAQLAGRAVARPTPAR
jgi:putative membrane protein